MIHPGGRAAALFERLLRQSLAGAHDVLDTGTSQRFAKELRRHEALFDGLRYVATGYRPATTFGRYNCDGHEDIEAMSFADASFDAVICLEVLEHVRHPERAAAELMRVLRPGGRLLLSTPFLASYHGKGSGSQRHEEYPDFWRFTHEGLAALFAPMTGVEVHPVDGPIEMRLTYLRLAPLFRHAPLRGLLDAIDRPVAGRATTRHLLLAVK